jgi:hypothetical protein
VAGKDGADAGATKASAAKEEIKAFLSLSKSEVIQSQTLAFIQY